MTVTFISTNTTGAGNRFAFAAAGDALVVLPGATIGSTNSTAFSTGFHDVEVSVLGTMVSALQVSLFSNSSFNLGANASFLSFEPDSVDVALLLNGTGNEVLIEGSFSAVECIGILSGFGSNRVTVTGSVTAASGVFLGLAGIAGDILVNSGTISANANDDAARNTRFNNSVFTEGANTSITNLAGGVITATSSEGNGVRVGAGGNGSVVTNHGTITSINAAGVDFSGALTARLINTGLIQGATVSFNGNDGGTYAILNSGHMIGDVFMGTGNDVFDGRGGRIDGVWFGDDGADFYDGRGASLISGTISGGTGNDTLLGGDGAETINGDTNLDTIRGGGGDDLLYGGLNSDLLAGDGGNDELHGGADFDDMSGGTGDDVIYGEDGGLLGRGGDGNDELSVESLATAWFVGGYGGAGDDLFYGGAIRDNIWGGSGDDEIYSDDGGDFVYGGTGDDTVDSFDGDDTVYGGAGDDLVTNAVGNAQLFGGRGLDTVTGGDGNDLLDGGADGDSLVGGIGLDTVFGGSGDDDIFGGNDNDSLEGGTGNDVILTGTGNDRANGGTGNDSLSGEAGRDTMNGGAGDDTLIGGASQDVQSGGTGADVFVLTAVADSGITLTTLDTIADFLSGTDRLDLSLIDANTLIAGNDVFTFIGGAAFSNTAGELQYVAAFGVLLGDVNGDGLQDFRVDFLNLTALVATDFVL